MFKRVSYGYSLVSAICYFLTCSRRLTQAPYNCVHTITLARKADSIKRRDDKGCLLHSRLFAVAN